MSRRTLLSLFAVSFVLAMSSPVLTEPIDNTTSLDLELANKHLKPGEMPYTPTRLEWAAVVMNSGGALPYSDDTGFSIGFVADHEDGELQVHVAYHQAKTDHEFMRAVTAKKVKAAEAFAIRQGWNDWMDVTTRFRRLDK